MSEPKRYLRFVGRLWANMIFEPGIGWETERVENPPFKDLNYQLDLLAADGTPLVTVPPEVRSSDCASIGGSMAAQRVRGYLPLHPDARAVVFRRGDQRIHRVALAATRPFVVLRELTIGDGRVDVRWEASHEKRLTFSVGYFVGRSRGFSMVQGLTSSKFTIDTTKLPGGSECHIVVMATDGLRSSFVPSDPFPVPEKAPRVFILRPATGELEADQPVSLCGQVQDIGGDSLPGDSLVWMIDGVIVGRGQRILATAPLEPGSHTIVLAYIQSGQILASASTEVLVAALTDAQQEWKRLAHELDSLPSGIGSAVSRF